MVRVSGSHTLDDNDDEEYQVFFLRLLNRIFEQIEVNFYHIHLFTIQLFISNREKMKFLIENYNFFRKESFKTEEELLPT